MKFCHSRRFGNFGSLIAVSLLIVFSRHSSAQTCFTSDDMDAAVRSSLQAAAGRYFDMVARGDTATLKQNSISAVATNFAGIESAIKEHESELAGAHANPRPSFLLKAEGTAPLTKAEFLCGIFGASGQTTNSAEFVIPNLPPGTYGVVTMDVPTQKSGYTLALVLQQQGTNWKIGGFFLRPTQIAGHDSSWFLEHARTFKSKGQTHNAWLYFIEGRELAMPVPFMYTQLTDKLYEEIQSVKPADFPVDGKTADLAAGSKTYRLTTVFPLAVGQDLDLVVKYATADVSNSGQTFQDNMTVMKALIMKFPELRDAFAGVVARAVEPSGRDYGSLMPMKDIK
ncbi:MAG: hypothetical protein JO159_11285 [Acidobacteria bacterium]|nr:hypothetical protein [Acidobacteriota bacterium]MBV9624383.1 hypothetical protein [Acidobacteriota bacterium]